MAPAHAFGLNSTNCRAEATTTTSGKKRGATHNGWPHDKVNSVDSLLLHDTLDDAFGAVVHCDEIDALGELAQVELGGRLSGGHRDFNLGNWQIDDQWLGVYSQCKDHDIFQATVDGKVHIVTGIGSKAMTASPRFSHAPITTLYGRD